MGNHPPTGSGGSVNFKQVTGTVLLGTVVFSGAATF